jgi:hypothetical protein
MLKLTESRPEERVTMRLEFFEPFTATNTTEFIFSPHWSETSVTWSMSGKNNFVGKAMSLVMNCEKMVGGQFDQGFANLRAVLETQKSLTARH